MTVAVASRTMHNLNFGFLFFSWWALSIGFPITGKAGVTRVLFVKYACGHGLRVWARSSPLFSLAAERPLNLVYSDAYRPAGSVGADWRGQGNARKGKDEGETTPLENTSNSTEEEDKATSDTGALQSTRQCE